MGKTSARDQVHDLYGSNERRRVQAIKDARTMARPVYSPWSRTGIVRVRTAIGLAVVRAEQADKREARREIRAPGSKQAAYRRTRGRRRRGVR